jgi:hypothetical protein
MIQGVTCRRSPCHVLWGVLLAPKGDTTKSDFAQLGYLVQRTYPEASLTRVYFPRRHRHLTQSVFRGPWKYLNFFKTISKK